MIPNILYLDPTSDLNQKIQKVEAINEYIDVRPHLAIFDGVAVPKDATGSGPAILRIGERGRRLVMFENEADQHFLSENGLIYGSYNDPELSLQDSAFVMASEFSNNSQRMSEKNLILPKRFFHGRGDYASGVKVEFIEGLTIAPQNTSLDDLIKFKNLHRRSYDEFWDYLTKTVESINFGGHSNTNVINGFISAAEEYEVAARNTWGRRVANSFNIEFDLGNMGFILGELSAMTAREYLELSPVVLMVPILGAVKFTACLTPRRDKISEGAKAMAYAFEVKKLP